MSELDDTFERLLGELAAAPPDDLQPRLVLADLLCERGHPLGEVLQLAARPELDARALWLLTTHERAFCGLVAPRAVAAWVHRGLPEIAWYHSEELLAVERPRFPLLRQVTVGLARTHTAAVLAHPLLHHVRSLTLVAPPGEPACPAPGLHRLESLTLCQFSDRGLRELLRSVPTLRRLCLQTFEPRHAWGALEVLRELRPRLESLELETTVLLPEDVEPVAAACGATRVTVRSALAQPDGGLVARDAFLEAGVEGPQLVLSLRPALWQPVGTDPTFVAALVQDMRERAVRIDPLFARARFDFLDGAPLVRDELILGDSLQQREGRPASRELLETFRRLTLSVDDLRPGELDPGAICVAPETRVLSPWAHRSVLRGRLAYLSPEEVRGLRPGPAASVFSLGVLLFQTLARRLPHLAPQPELSLLECIVKGRFASLASVAPVSAELAALVSAMLALEPSARPSPLQVASRLTGLMERTPSDPGFRLATRPRPEVSLSAAERFVPATRT